MTKICVTGGRRLEGCMRIPGGKNAILPILGAALLSSEPVVIRDCPKLTDVDNMLAILKCMGCDYQWDGSQIEIDASKANSYEMPEKLGKELRSSIFMLGPVVGRFGKARFTYPGGCEIGNRPIDLHIKGLHELNVIVNEEGGYINCDGENMRGPDIHLDYPSVGATENIMMAAVAATGQTTIRNAAREPEIEDLQKFLVAMGAEIEGAGSSTITIQGKRPLNKSVTHTLLPDRIVAGTMLVASAITGGDLTILNVEADHIHSILSKLRECGCRIHANRTAVRIIGPKRPREMRIIETLPYPGFPTDMQAQMFALATVAEGTSVIVENVFENRYKFANELIRMGAVATIKDRMAIVRGVPRLSGTEVNAPDLRGGAALVLAGLRAEGLTVVDGVNFIDRGYDAFEVSLQKVGADIQRIQD